MTYMLLLNCALKLVEEIFLYYDARSKKHQITLDMMFRYLFRTCTFRLGKLTWRVTERFVDSFVPFHSNNFVQAMRPP